LAPLSWALLPLQLARWAPPRARRQVCIALRARAAPPGGAAHAARALRR
jgi:hypothetical protein